MQTILVLGGAGYIGSHTCLQLIEAGHRVIVLDNFSNGHRDAVFADTLIEGDLLDVDCLNSIFSNNKIDAVIHFAALIEAGVSMNEPLNFYKNNVTGTLNLLQMMIKHGVNKLVFSSTAAVYGEPEYIPIDEDHPKAAINPYGQTKWAAECMMRDSAVAYGLNTMVLRYFNAAGGDPEGRTGERHDPETHLIPLVMQAANGTRDAIKIFGTDYETTDGTCIRDYIHVSDLADAHIKALDYLTTNFNGEGFYDACNLGNGNGYSVREVIDAVANVTGKDFTVIEEARRLGDPASLIADSKKAKSMLGWQPRYASLDDMVAHAWSYEQQIKN